MATSGASGAKKLSVASPASFSAFVDAVSDYAIFLLDPEGFVLTWNKGAQRLKGYRPEEIIGQHFSRFYSEAEVRAGKCDFELEGAARDGRFEDEGWRYRKDGSRFWANVVITVLKDEHGKVEGFTKVTRDLTERRTAEDSARRLAEERAARQALESTQARLQFLSDAGRILGGSLDYADTLSQVARLAVPVIADWSTVALQQADTREFRRVAVFHKDVTKADLVKEYEERFSPLAHRNDGFVVTLQSGSPVMYAHVSDKDLQAAAQGPEHLRILRGLGVRSCIMVPLLSRSGPVGVISLMRSDEGNAFTPLDLTLAEELAARASVAIDNARLYEAERRAHAAAEAERSRLASLFLQAPAIVNVFRGPEHVFELVHPMAQALFPGRALLGLPARQAMPELAGQDFFEALDRVYATGETFRGLETVWRLKTPEGATRELVFNLVHQPWRDGDGKIGGVMTFAFDVSAQVQAREREAELARRLQVGEELFRALVDNLPQLAWSAGPSGDLDFYNRRWYDYTGTTFEQMQGWGWQSVHDPEVLPKVVENWKRAVATGEPFEMEFPLRGADGVFRWFLTRVRPLKDADGKVLRWFGTNTNVDEQRRHKEALQEAIKVRDTFLSVASHELKTPLTPMALRLQALENLVGAEPETPYTRQVRGYVETARRQIGKLTALVNDLLDVSRIVSGQFRMEVEDVDVAELVREVAGRFEQQAQLSATPLKLSAPASLRFRTARLRLEQVFTNLLDNALKYGAGKPVDVELEEVAGGLCFQVRDRGIGVSAQDAYRIFDRFERAVSDRHYGGLGLGLYISRTIVETLGGTIQVKSELGEGAVFTVELPSPPPP